MKKIDSVYIEDILSAITAIEGYVAGIDFDQFASEDMRHDAVIRQLEIIGEATNKLSTEFCSLHQGFPVRQAISMRNFLIHGYDEIKLEVVWSTVQKNLPVLKLEAEMALNK